MNAEPSVNAERERKLDEVIFAYLKAAEAGAKPDRRDWLARYPDLAPELAEFFANRDQFDAVVGSLAGGSRNGAESTHDPRPPELGQLGDFRLLREVGRGGMGVVYEAEQISLGRRVALKVLPFAAALDAKQLQRFKNEAQAAAHLQHQNIVPVYYVGCERGVHFYAMQFIEGQTLAAVIADLRQLAGNEKAGVEGSPEQLSEIANALASGRLPVSARPSPDEQPTTPYAPAPVSPAPETTAKAGLSTARSITNQAYFRTVARLGEQAAEALEHAHDLGVIHRDVKPGNLLVDGRANLWITDFGLAHCQSQAGLTMTGDLVGTLRYMSSEQALAKRGVVDHRTDVYSLGATLYELLTLQPAFTGSDRQELLRQIAFEEPRRLRSRNKAIPVELETIAMKALEKNPADRYATAKELADDLRRFLEDKPIRARRPTLVQRVRKWGRRHWSIVAAALVSLLLTAAAGTLLIAAAYQSEKTQRKAAEEAEGKEKEQRHLAEDQRDEAERQVYLSRMQLIPQAWEAAHVERARELLESLRPAEGRPDLRGWEWYYWQGLCHSELLTIREYDKSRIAWSPDGSRLACAGSEDGTISIWEVATGKKQRVLHSPKRKVRALAWSLDDRWLASSAGSDVRVWDAATGKERVTLRELEPDEFLHEFLQVGSIVRVRQIHVLDRLSKLVARPSFVGSHHALVRVTTRPTT
jgi:serine/threonine protein kinase